MAIMCGMQNRWNVHQGLRGTPPLRLSKHLRPFLHNWFPISPIRLIVSSSAVELFLACWQRPYSSDNPKWEKPQGVHLHDWGGQLTLLFRNITQSWSFQCSEILVELDWGHVAQSRGNYRSSKWIAFNSGKKGENHGMVSLAGHCNRIPDIITK